MKDCYGKSETVKHPIPVHFISGEQDPCAPDRKGFDAAVQRMKDAGYRRVTSKMYPGMRHEILNHTEHQVVFDDLLADPEKYRRMGKNARAMAKSDAQKHIADIVLSLIH